MSAEALWRLAVRLVLAARHADAHLAAMSNEELDRWLEESS